MKHDLQVAIIKELMSQLDEGRNVDAGVQYKMTTQSYVCPEIAEQEQKHFFMDHPQLIGLSGDLPAPGSFLTLDDFGVPILATRDKHGVFHAFERLPASLGQSGSGGKGHKTRVHCPFHHWSYANSGELLTIPNNDHFGDIDKSCNGLIELPCAEESGLLWVPESAGAS